MVIKLIFPSAIILSGLYCRWKYCFLSDIIIFIDREIIFAFYEVEFTFVDIQIFQAVFEACSLMKKDKESMRIIMSTLSGIAAAVPGFKLENRPEREAAVMLARHIEGFNDIM